MKAVAHAKAGPPDGAGALIDIDAPEPAPGPHDLLVAVKAVAMNPVDWMVRPNMPSAGDAPRILGWDAAGEVLAVGAAVRDFAPGDRVLYAGALDRPGANAQRQAVDARLAGRLPDAVSYADGAAAPLTAITAWEMLFDRLRVGPASHGALLLVGAGGGVGAMMTQLSRALTGLIVIATAGRAETAAWLTSLGAHHVVDHGADLAPELADVAPQGLDAAVMLNGTDAHIAPVIAMLRPQARLGMVGDRKSFDIFTLKTKRISLHLEFMITRSLSQTEDTAAQVRLLTRVADLLAKGRITTTRTR